ncbi:hypothetical protein ARMSODRAFT_976258 [Armillaria solidipes]|uniref:Uncharacterized protein n=1 Tax=Armillaria solidipes TaxID=1076256 RepID=A0A2H3BAQ3_9AGAR|nr:hypothetical protein ARMSODRAFT_976258 [Armillaria solidipes]
MFERHFPEGAFEKWTADNMDGCVGNDISNRYLETRKAYPQEEAMFEKGVDPKGIDMPTKHIPYENALRNTSKYYIPVMSSYLPGREFIPAWLGQQVSYTKCRNLKWTSHGPPKQPRKVVKQPQDIVSPLPPTPSNNSDIFPPPPTGRFPLPPSVPPPQKSRVELPDFIMIPPSAFPKDEPEPPRSSSHHRTEWYCAPQPQPQLQPEAPSPAPARRCHLTSRRSPTVHKKARYICGMERAHQLPSPALSSSTTGEGSGSSWSRFPSPPPLPPTSRRITSASTFDTRLPSPSFSGASSRPSTPPYTTPRYQDRL